jgi:hypothetical protein
MTTQPTTNQDSNNEPINTSAVQTNPLDAITVYYSNIIKTKQPLQPRPLSSIVRQIRTSADLQKKISQIRAITVTKARQDKKEAILPAFWFQQFQGNKRKNIEFESTKFIIQDLDHISATLQDVRNKLAADNDVFMVFLSPSGDGLKVVYEMDQPVTGVEQYRNAFRYFKDLLETKHTIPVDYNDDPARACYLSFDPELHVNMDRKLHSLPVSPAVVTQSPKPVSKVAVALTGSTSPGRTDAMASLIGYYNSLGMDETMTLSVVHDWNKQHNTPPLDDNKVEDTVRDMYARYKEQSSIQRTRIISQDNCYITVTVRGGKNIKSCITNFIIEPKELLMLNGSDCLTCSIITDKGIRYDDIVIENSDWHSKSKLLKAIGHQDCSFTGPENDVQNLCCHVNSNVPIRKSGSKVIGLVKGTWVVEGMNITKDGKSTMSVVPYQKGADAFYHKIKYEELDDVSYSKMLNDFYSNITSMNTQETILPILGWNFAAPMKPIIMDHVGSFPLMFIHGGQGGGKTSTVSQFMRLHGYKDAKPQMCDMKPFPMLKLLSSTNAIPVVLDEFKVRDMKQDSVDSLLRFMRKAYDGEVETKGRQDQTTESYNLEAPMIVMGEWNINQPAIKERIVFPRFTSAAKQDKTMQTAFKNIFSLPLEGFMPRYVEYCLGLDVKCKYNVASRLVRAVFRETNIAPRIHQNLSTMIMGLMLFKGYGQLNNITVPKIDYKGILKSQLKEITGNNSGMVRSAVDQLIEALAVMAQNRTKENYYNATPDNPNIIKPNWFKLLDVVDKDNNNQAVKCIAIQFNQIFPEFKEYAKRTNYEGDLLDAESFKKLFAECPYIFKTSHPVNYNDKLIRSICIDVDKAKAEGINMEGFGVSFEGE